MFQKAWIKAARTTKAKTVGFICGTKLGIGFRLQTGQTPPTSVIPPSLLCHQVPAGVAPVGNEPPQLFVALGPDSRLFPNRDGTLATFQDATMLGGRHCRGQREIRVLKSGRASSVGAKSL